MTSHNSIETSDTSILVLHPLSAPNVINTDGALEFEEERMLVLPAQQQLKDAMIRALAEFVSFRRKSVFAIKSRFRVESQGLTEFPAINVVRLDGPGVTPDEVSLFRAAGRVILGSMILQRSLGEQDMSHLFSEKERLFLAEQGNVIAAKFANRSITQGFKVRFGVTDLDGITVQGVMPALSLKQRAHGTVAGICRPLGFDEQKGTAILLVTEAANDEEPESNESKEQLTGRLEVVCHNLSLFRTLALAYANRNLVEFKALSQPEARKKKPVFTLLELLEIAANDKDDFKLE